MFAPWPVNSIRLSRNLRRAALIAVSVTAIGSQSLHAQRAGNVDPTFDASLGLSSGVYTVTLQSDGKIIAGGDFSKKVARLETSGDRDTTFDTGTAYSSQFYHARAVHVLPSGQILVGGLFGDIGGTPRNNLARLNADGSVDRDFLVGLGTEGDLIGQPNFAGEIAAVAVQSDGNILIGGNFTSCQGAARRGLARLSTNGALDPSFDPSAVTVTGKLSADVTSLAVLPDGNVLVGSSSGLVRLKPNGEEDTSFQSPAAGFEALYQVKTLALQGDKIIVGGYLTVEVNAGNAHEIFYRLNSDGSTDGSFTTGNGTEGDLSNFPTKKVLVLPGGRILVGGEFQNYNGVTRGGVVLLSRDGTVDQSFNPSGVGGGGTVSGLAYDAAANKVVVVKNGTILRLNLDGSPDAAFSPTQAPGPDGPVWAIARQTDSTILLGGQFNQVNGLSYPMIARLLDDGSIDPDFKPLKVSGQSYLSIYAILVQGDGKILIGGQFNIAGHVNLARLNADGSFDASFNAGSAVASGGLGVTTIALQGDKILAGGEFTRARDASAAGNHLVRLFSNGSVDTGFDVGNAVSGGLDDFATFAIAVTPENKILVGGNFDVNRQQATVNYLIQFTENGQVDTSFRTGSFGPLEKVYGVRTIKVQPDGKILVGGDFENIGGTPRNGIARLNKDGGLDASFNPGTGFQGQRAVIASLDFQGDDIIVGGNFSIYNGRPVVGLIRVDRGGALETSFKTVTDALVNAVLVRPEDKSILIGGYFTGVDSSVRNFAARVGENGMLDLGFDPGAGATSVAVLAVQSDGKVLAGGNLGSNPRLDSHSDGIKHSHISRFTRDGVADPAFDPGDGPDGAVEAIGLQSDGSIVVGGEFKSVNGRSAVRIARLLGSGKMDAAFNAGGSGFDGTVRSVAVLGDQKLVVGGDFTHYNGILANHLLLLLANGQPDPAFDASKGADAPVYAVAPLNDGSGRFLAGGNFQNLGGAPSGRLGLVKADGSADSSVDTSGVKAANGTVTVIKVLRNGNGGVIVGGTFTSIGGLGAAGLARLGVDGSFDSSFRAGGAAGIRRSAAMRRPKSRFAAAAERKAVSRRLAETSDPAAIFGIDEEVSGKLVVGGIFDQVGDLLRSCVARLNPDGSVDPSYDSGAGSDGPVRSIQLQSDPDGSALEQKAVIGGDFASIDDNPRSAVARLLGNQATTISVAATRRVATVVPRTQAIVTITRTGDLSSELVVNYSVRGNAVAGTDYKALPESVSIPAGQASIKIKVKPRDAGSPQPNKKIVLKFAPGDSYTIVGKPKVKLTIDYDPTE